MQELLDWLEYLEDGRQQSKVFPLIKNIQERAVLRH